MTNMNRLPTTQPSGRIIAVGDIHGCLTAFKRLLTEIQPAPDDTLILLGDYIDRGPDSKGVVDEVLQLCEACNLIPLMGNHEQMLRAARTDQRTLLGWLQSGGAATLDSYGYGVGPNDLPADHLAFYDNCLPYFETPTHFFVHANYDANLPLAEQPDTERYWESLRDKIPARHISGKTAIVGHTPQPDGVILDRGYLKGIDTKCYDNGWLTALDVDTGYLWQTNQAEKLRVFAEGQP